MSDKIVLTKLRLVGGVWHGSLKHYGRDGTWKPNIEVTYLDFPVDGVEVLEDRVEEFCRSQSTELPTASRRL
jgi:hypothetical protein